MAEWPPRMVTAGDACYRTRCGIGELSRIIHTMIPGPTSPTSRSPRTLLPMRGRRRFVWAVWPFVITLFASEATAFPTSRLTYVRNKGAESCPSEEVVRAEVASRLGYDPFFVWAERTIVAQVWREPKGYRASVQLLDDKGVVSGSRSLRSHSDDCNELVKAAALAISIGIDPESATRPPGTPPQTPDPVRAEATVPPASTERASEPAPPNLVRDLPPNRDQSPEPIQPQPRVGLKAGAGLWSAVNLAPAISVGGTAFVGVEWRWFEVFAEIRKSLPASSAGVAADLLVGAVVPCARYEFLFVCGDVAWGALRLEGERAESVSYLAVGGRIGAQVSVARLALRPHLDVLAPINRTTVLLNRSEVWRLPSASAAIGLDAALHF